MAPPQCIRGRAPTTGVGCHNRTAPPYSRTAAPPPSGPACEPAAATPLRVRDPAIVPDLAPQAAFRQRYGDPVLVNIKPDMRDTIPQDPSPMPEARHRPIRCNP